MSKEIHRVRPNAKPRKLVWDLRPIQLPMPLPMPMPRKPFFTSKTHHQNLIFLLLIFLSCSTSCAANNEVASLISWLQTSPSPLPHSFFSNWNPSDPNPCNWTYITCSSQNFVTQITIQSIDIGLPFPSNLSSLKFLQNLTISGTNLTGTIPLSIGGCTSLISIDISSNNLFGSIPTSIGLLKSLQDFVVNSNQLSGPIPQEIGNCTNLRSLLLFDNQISGGIPTEIGKLLNLEVFRAGGNRDITGNIPDEIGNCRNLTVIGLADTKVSGSLPTSLGNLKQLQTLSVYTTLLSGEIPPEIGNCSELVDLYLYENNLSGSIPIQLGNLENLEKLLLWENNLVGSIPDEIGNCRSLLIMDLSLNSLSGSIPESFGNLSMLEELMLSNNNISGSIPPVLSNATALVQLQLDTNQISGTIPPELGMLTELTVFFAWQNKLEGNIPSQFSGLKSLQSMDLSNNFITGSIPPGLFHLQNLTKLLLIYNQITGSIPPEIGNCSSLVRLRLVGNSISGGVPKEIGFLNSLSFLDISDNNFIGSLPNEIGNCSGLQMLNLSNNSFGGVLPLTLSSLTQLEVLDVSVNKFEGQIPGIFGHLNSLNTLILSTNSFSGPIPTSLGQCLSLQLLDLSSNSLSGNIPVELCQIEGLDIALNLSWNKLTGVIPTQISALNKLSTLDLSHNQLGGGLMVLSGLENLVSLNVSYNDFTGYLPDNKLFRQMSAAELEGNEGLCTSGQNSCFLNSSNGGTGALNGSSRLRRSWRIELAVTLLAVLTVAMAVVGIIVLFRTRVTNGEETDSEMGGGNSFLWQISPFQKLNFSVEQVLKCLVESNVIGKGCSGMVYRAEMDTGEVIAVKKLWPTTMGSKYSSQNNGGVRDSFSTEVKTLGSIRHKRIVKFLGCCWNQNTRLLMYDYMPNGSLGSLLHESSGSCLEWELRYKIVLGAAQGLAYLHHDCVPPIVHRDIKANNILIGLEFEPYIADFGLAKLVDAGDFARSSSTVAGSYGYIAPEYGYMMKITEKSDVYSYGVVVLEVLTGKQPIDPTIPEGLHIVDWVRQKKGGIEVLDPGLRSRPESEIEEMLQTLGVALLCVNSSPDDRPTMKDVAAVLEEIRHGREEFLKADQIILQGESKASGDGQDDQRSSGGGTSTKIEGLHLGSNNSSFSASSLLYSSSSNAKVGFK
ncbi:hypothetical protein RHGRI_035929 [Rhododendron griersonianum]|uniref:Protein kinase domain-containing protein n=1 Tax=Rhododendron griersonianum TaxID=479676 RepID=A0AAV6HRS2_9ERIC|nr:hypothetical protein RHGRI_035929 [Rhododendron griersonianum]